MQKQAPTLGRLFVMVAFALSCFGLLLFLWLSFGGTVPLKPKGYRFKIAFPEATQLGQYADVRTAGVSVGKVVGKSLDKHANRTVVTVQLDGKFAPLVPLGTGWRPPVLNAAMLKNRLSSNSDFERSGVAIRRLCTAGFRIRM